MIATSLGGINLCNWGSKEGKNVRCKAMWVAVSSVTLRAKPSTKSAKIASLPRNRHLSVIIKDCKGVGTVDVDGTTVKICGHGEEAKIAPHEWKGLWKTTVKQKKEGETEWKTAETTKVYPSPMLNKTDGYVFVQAVNNEGETLGWVALAKKGGQTYLTFKSPQKQKEQKEQKEQKKKKGPSEPLKTTTVRATLGTSPQMKAVMLAGGVGLLVFFLLSRRGKGK